MKEGYVPSLQEFFEAARKLTAEAGSLLIVDEIQSGLGRTGKWCAYQHYGIQPDITTLAKPLAGGLPLGAMLCTGRSCARHSRRNARNNVRRGPLACNVAIAVIDAMRQGEMLQHIAETGDYFKTQLKELAKKHPSIIDVRGMGLMLAAELDSADMAKEVVAQMLQRHILINRTSETVLRFLPPYILSVDDVNTAIAALNEILTGLESTATEAHPATSSHEGRN